MHVDLYFGKEVVSLHAIGQYPSALDKPHLGQLIRHLREQRRMTQGALAEDICFRTYISQIEQGIRFPTAKIVAQLADRLEVPLTLFVHAYIHAPEAAPTQCLALSNLLAERGEIAAATDVLQTAVTRLEEELRPDAYSTDVLESQGLIEYFSGRLTEARHSFRQALDSRQRVPSRRYTLGRAAVRYGIVLMVTGQLGEACGVLAEAFYQILQLNPASVPESTDAVISLHGKAAEALGIALLHAHSPWLATAIFRMAEQRWDDYGFELAPTPSLRLCRALALNATGRDAEAQRIMDNLMLQPGAPDTVARAHSNAGLWARLRGEWAEAMRHQSQAWRLWQQAGAGDPLLTANELARATLHAGDYAEVYRWLHEDTLLPVLEKQNAVTDCVQRTVRQLLFARTALLQGDRLTAAQHLDAVRKCRHNMTTSHRTILLRLAELLDRKLEQSSLGEAVALVDELDHIVMPKPYGALPAPVMPC